MKRLTVEIIPDLEQGGFAARVPDIPAHAEGRTEQEAIATFEKLCEHTLKPLASRTPARA